MVLSPPRLQDILKTLYADFITVDSLLQTGTKDTETGNKQKKKALCGFGLLLQAYWL